MLLDLQIQEMAMPRIVTLQLSGAVRALQEIAVRNLVKSQGRGESRQFRNRKEEMKLRLMKRGKSTFEEATNVVGRERLLLSLYSEYANRLDASWLPPFDESIAISVLGDSGNGWHAGRRRQAAQLFFTQFKRLPNDGLIWLCKSLREAYRDVGFEKGEQTRPWQTHGDVLFRRDSDHHLVRTSRSNETLTSLLERFAIPKEGRFAECLRQMFLLEAIKKAPLGQEIPSLAEIESLKAERASESQLMGAAALQIMVQRVAKEGRRQWSGDWPKWIVRLGCDPRHGRSTAEGAKWWGWATADELRLAQQAITGLTLDFFIGFLRRSLQGTDKESQFERRSRFLMRLFETGKIESARLVLNRTVYHHLDKKYRDVWTVAQLTSTTQETSMICLKCIDDIYVIEGTHSFGLRMFHREFPIRGFWELPKLIYQDSELRISPDDCPVFLRHDANGNWVNTFFREMRHRFRIEWNDVQL